MSKPYWVFRNTNPEKRLNNHSLLRQLVCGRLKMNVVENNYFESTIDPREEIQAAKNHTIELETLQFNDWKQKLLLNKEEITHNYKEIIK